LSASLPLAGVRVLDLSRVLAGPMCAQALGDFGADVIKIEHPKRGDDTRDWGIRIGQTETAYYASANRNKRSVTVDLQTPEGQQLVRDLAKQCDVVLQNFKYGGVEKMGLGFEDLRALQPELIYCSISGYNRSGPEAARPGYDIVVQGEAGLMALNGELSQPPLKFGVAAVDMVTGMYATQAILAALFERERERQAAQASGQDSRFKGRHIEMALFDSGLLLTSYVGLEALLRQQEPLRYGNEHPTIVPYGVFQAADGALVIAVGNNSQYGRFCHEVIERPDLADAPELKTNLSRVQRRETLVPELLKEIKARPRELLLSRMKAAQIPCGEVLGVLEALQSQRAQQGELVTEQPHAWADDGKIHVMAPPYRLDGQRLPVRRAPPMLGEHTEAVLAELLALPAEELARLKALGVI
jgi:crotonobetainyl-CoA:carnitine CoA-transferase CaiB-like acyl-CoA transferase